MISTVCRESRRSQKRSPRFSTVADIPLLPAMSRHIAICVFTFCTISVSQIVFAELPIQRASFKPVKLSAKLIPIQLIDDSEEDDSEDSVSTLERIKSMVPVFGSSVDETNLSRPEAAVELLPIPAQETPSKSRLQRLMAKVGLGRNEAEESVEIQPAGQSESSTPNEITKTASSQESTHREFALPRILPSFRE